MFSRNVVLPAALLTAAAVPYLMSESKLPQKAKQQFQSAMAYVTTDDTPSTHFPSEFSHGAKSQNPQTDLDSAFAGPPCADFSEVFRADITPQWVTQRWPRVSTVTAELGLEGLRVPLVSGTRVDDVAGTLTYYFNPYQQVQRLAFDGFTGDERRLLTMLTAIYGLKPEPTLDAGMYVSRWNATPTSVLKIARAPIITSTSPHSQLHLQLELNRPSVTYGLSAEFRQFLDRDRNTNRWQ
jgi:hypothetical protein